MAQTQRIVETLKRALKTKGKTYADVARHLDLSEASIKRLFAEQSLSLQRLDKICQFLDLQISDLIEMMQQQQGWQLSALSWQQEEELVNDINVLLVAVCVLNYWTFENILSRYDFTEAECISLLARLDRLKLIELLPGNRIRLLVASNFKWLDNGPIQRFFQEKIEHEFFNSDFSHRRDKLIVVNGMLSDKSNAHFQLKLEQLAREFDLLNRDDIPCEFEDKQGVTVVLAMRQWYYGLYQHLRK